MAKNQENAEQLGRAWALHRKGQNEDAIREFSALLRQSALHIDALYGLALSQRSAGHTEAAQESFTTCLTQIESALVDHPNEDRYEMLQKMTRQRLDELKAR